MNSCHKEEHAHLWLTNIAVRYNNLQYNVIAVMWMREATDSEDDRTMHDLRLTARARPKNDSEDDRAWA